MKISEYDLLAEAFTRSFGFMLNRIEDEVGHIEGRFDGDEVGKRDRAEDRCFTEFLCALEEMGVELETVRRDITDFAVRKPLPPPGEEE